MVRTAWNSGTWTDLPLSSNDPTGAYARDALVRDRVVSSTQTWPGAATDWTRAAVLTASPATMPSPTAPKVTATWPVVIPTRMVSPSTPASSPSAVMALARSSPARTARSASSSRAAGTPQTANTASPMNFSTAPPYRSITARARSK